MCRGSHNDGMDYTHQAHHVFALPRGRSHRRQHCKVNKWEPPPQETHTGVLSAPSRSPWQGEVPCARVGPPQGRFKMRSRRRDKHSQSTMHVLPADAAAKTLRLHLSSAKTITSIHCIHSWPQSSNYPRLGSNLQDFRWLRECPAVCDATWTLVRQVRQQAMEALQASTFPPGMPLE